MRDLDVRRPLRRQLEYQHHDAPDTLIVAELGVCEGAVRVDLAVVNGLLAGYEIKSAKDTLERLPLQAAAYNKVFDEVTIVAAGDHVDVIETMVPKWWGITRAAMQDGAVALQELRRTAPNPAVDSFSVAQLLWRDEVLDFLERRGLARGMKGKPRSMLWARLAEAIPVDGLRELVRDRLRARDNWRLAPPPRSGDAMYRPSSTLFDSRS